MKRSLVSYSFDMQLAHRLYKELKYLNTKSPYDTIKIWISEKEEINNEINEHRILKILKIKQYFKKKMFEHLQSQLK